jgi:hypothetical protein
MWQDELVTRGLDIGMTTIAAVLAWGARSLLARKEGRVERMAERRRLAMELLDAVMGLQAFAEVHRVRWYSRHERAWTAIEVVTEFLRLRPQTYADFTKGLPGAVSIVRRWGRSELEEGITGALAAQRRLISVLSSIILFGDVQLTEAAQAVVDRAFEVAAMMSDRASARAKAQKRLDDALRAFGAVAGLQDGGGESTAGVA